MYKIIVWFMFGYLYRKHASPIVAETVRLTMKKLQEGDAPETKIKVQLTNDSTQVRSDSKEYLDELVEELLGLLKKDRVFTLGELKQLLNVKSTYLDERLYWPSLLGMRLEQDVSDGMHVLHLPEPTKVSGV